MIRLAYQFGPSIYSCAYLKNESPVEMYRRLCFVPFIYEDEVRDLIDGGDIDYIENGKTYRESKDLEGYVISSGVLGYIKQFYKSENDTLYIFLEDEWYIFNPNTFSFILLEKFINR